MTLTLSASSNDHNLLRQRRSLNHLFPNPSLVFRRPLNVSNPRGAAGVVSHTSIHKINFFSCHSVVVAVWSRVKRACADQQDKHQYLYVLSSVSQVSLEEQRHVWQVRGSTRVTERSLKVQCVGLSDREEMLTT